MNHTRLPANPASARPPHPSRAGWPWALQGWGLPALPTQVPALQRLCGLHIECARLAHRFIAFLTSRTSEVSTPLSSPGQGKPAIPSSRWLAGSMGRMLSPFRRASRLSHLLDGNPGNLGLLGQLLPQLRWDRWRRRRQLHLLFGDVQGGLRHSAGRNQSTYYHLSINISCPSVYHIYIYIYTHTCVYVYIYIYIHNNTYVYIYVYIYIYIHIYI